jgi:hypothetical protein
MFYTPTSSFNQVDCGKRPNKKRFDPASLPSINPTLISISCDTSRLIDEMEDAFNQISTATSNDGLEVTIARREGRSWRRGGWAVCWYNAARLGLGTAFDTLIYQSFHSLMGDVLCWYQDATGIRLTISRVLNSEFNIEPPTEIKIAVQALNLAAIKRKPLTDMALSIH